MPNASLVISAAFFELFRFVVVSTVILLPMVFDVQQFPYSYSNHDQKEFDFQFVYLPKFVVFPCRLCAGHTSKFSHASGRYRNYSEDVSARSDAIPGHRRWFPPTKKGRDCYILLECRYYYIDPFDRRESTHSRTNTRNCQGMARVCEH